MQLKFIYPTDTRGIPFFYIIQHIPTWKYYAGFKYSQKDNLTDSSIFMTEAGYQTSSDIIAEIIQKEGLAAFKIRKIRHFQTKEEANDYEIRFLNRVNARVNPSWYNQTNGGNVGIIQHSSESRLKISKANIGRKHSPETKAKISKANSNITDLTRKKMSDAAKNISKEHRRKLKESRHGKRWHTNGVTRTFCKPDNMPSGFSLGYKF